ncbi:hypothetical protein GUJ93_ZPchr0003g17877 [Zizania palustris]|uniref:Uncharacterized protein n=1 Tax=Zizania palustris TaxID=103762 RepID=A0A8J5RTZ0_ZIZPA|nr:hypothetical protein GUJ93_ZPchr0003g17877 [Zizania palustris]
MQTILAPLVGLCGVTGMGHVGLAGQKRRTAAACFSKGGWMVPRRLSPRRKSRAPLPDMHAYVYDKSSWPAILRKSAYQTFLRRGNH